MDNQILIRVMEDVDALDQLLANAPLVSDPSYDLAAQRRSRLDRKYALAVELFKLRDQARELEDWTSEVDEDFAEMARRDLALVRARLIQVEQLIEEAFRVKDERDVKNAVVEIRAGAGGDEAAIFAADLFRAYVRFAENCHLQVDIISMNGDGRSFKEVIFGVEGQGAYGLFRHEAGVHRVQRVPATEAKGRIHTSTAAVIVLLEAEPVDVHIPESDLRVDVFRSSSAGGQNVQKNATAIRITHIPTGLVVICQDERSQSQNRIRAMNVLRSRLYEIELQRRKDSDAAGRLDQVTSADRSEKIRTYNFPQSRITDHRTGDETHNLESFFTGEIGDFIKAVAVHLAPPVAI